MAVNLRTHGRLAFVFLLRGSRKRTLACFFPQDDFGANIDDMLHAQILDTVTSAKLPGVLVLLTGDGNFNSSKCRCTMHDCRMHDCGMHDGLIYLQVVPLFHGAWWRHSDMDGRSRCMHGGPVCLFVFLRCRRCPMGG